ncbi:MAG: hypothetical protein RMJ37_07240 [Spirochaetia bacterium]|nr:hypothetical protein [Spirochaetota bacterium]MCX8096096.1 hypothetical protein [Spirochaetota bacterium]MDW8113109.1 hypothetical protein [Spirochaetia bacterium]
MLIFPLGLIGVYTSFSRESVLDIQSIERLALESGFKTVGISDTTYPLWIDEVMKLQKSPITLFPAIRTFVNIQNQKIKLYVSPTSYTSLERLGRKETINIKELKSLDVIVFYGGNSKEHFLLLYDFLLGKLGLGLTKHNRGLLETVLSKVDYILPLHYSTIPQDLSKFKSVLKNFIPNPSPFPNGLTFIREIGELPQNVIDKITYTVEKMKDIRDYEIPTNKTNEDFSNLLWKKIVSQVVPDEKLRKEFIRISELGLSEFFYKLILSLEEFTKHGVIKSDFLSTSYILEKLKILKINKTKIVSLYHLLKEKPIHIDIKVSSKEKFYEIVKSNFGEILFHRVYPIHLRKRTIEENTKILPTNVRSLISNYLRNIVSEYRISKKLFYSNALRKRLREREGIPVEICGKSYEVVVDTDNLHYVSNRWSISQVMNVVKNDTLFITPHTISPFWDSVRKTMTPNSLSETLVLFHIAKSLSQKPYYKSSIERIVQEKKPIFIEDIIKDFGEDTIDTILNVVWSRDRKDIGVNEVELLKTLIDKGIDKEVAERTTRFIVKYKNVIGIRSLEISRFYDFLLYAGLKSENTDKFIYFILKETLRSKKGMFILLQFLKSNNITVKLDINNSLVSKVDGANNRYFLPLGIVRVNRVFLDKIVEEREKEVFKTFSEFYARVGKKFPKDTNKLARAGALDNLGDRRRIIKVSDNIDNEVANAILVREEFRTLGFCQLLLDASFNNLRYRIGCGDTSKVLENKTNNVFGFIASVDSYGNIFIQDEKNVIFAKNNIYTNFKIGDFGVFELSSEDGLFGKNFFVKSFRTLQ